MKIGLALSGGGIRAVVFHLGVFKCLAERGLLSNISHISSVSGASLCVGLIFAKNNYKWPSDKEFLSDVLLRVEKTILSNNIQLSTILRLPFYPQYWLNRVGLLARMLERKWGIEGSLRGLPDSPCWEINCTTFETGKSFRFGKKIMGDYKTGYVESPKVRIADAVAASAGFPVLIGPYRLDASKYTWRRPSVNLKRYHIWDGGVYDNMGIEPLYNEKGLRHGTNFLIVSNASASNGARQRSRFFISNAKRLLDITMDQIYALRSRTIFGKIVKRGKGQFINIGNSVEEIIKKYGGSLPDDVKASLAACSLSRADSERVSRYPTTLSTPSAEDYELILRHGYENTNCVFACRDSKKKS